MEAAVFDTLRYLFDRAAELEAERVRLAELNAEIEWLNKDKHDRRKAEEKDKEERQLLEALTAAEIAAFDSRLDDYDTRTVAALMKNREALDRVQNRLNTMLAEAYVLPDGRRVFKTEDGRQVFDEHGAAVSPQTIDPNLIDDHHPSWDTYKAGKEAQTRLQDEQRDLLAFQAKLDHARERADSGNMTKKEMAEVGADLAATAPPTVRDEINPEEAHSKLSDRPRPDQISGQPISLIDDSSRVVRLSPASP